MAGSNTPGLYGKLPVRGDFVSRRLPADFVQTWDAWLQDALSTSRDQLGAEWLEAYLLSPIWRFVLSPGNCGPTAWAGILMPSVDKVNRHFPLTVAVSIDQQNALPSLFVTAASWFGKLEHLALSALEDALNLDDFDRHLQEQALEVPSRTKERHTVRDDATETNRDAAFHIEMGNLEQISDACLQLSAGLLAKFLPVHSLWATRGSESERVKPSLQVKPCLLVYDGLPPATVYSELMTGQWKQHAWRDQTLVPFAAFGAEERESVAFAEQIDDKRIRRMRWQSCARTTAGKLRKMNEDAYLERPEIGLWAVADGMGGHEAGDVASQAIVTALDAIPGSDDLENLAANVAACLHQVNAELIAMAGNISPGQIIGSTVVVMLAVGHHCASIWVGDSRLYCYRDGVLSQLTRDHSLTAELSYKGVFTEEES
jgi:type VI secretion system protein ImpM